MQNDRPNEILEQYGCGPIQFTGTSDALYERHLIFDHVTDPKKADPREQFEAAARSVRDIISPHWLKTEKTYELKNPKRVVVDLVPLGALKTAVTLAEIKAMKIFADSPLVRQGRLSVVPLDAAQWKANTIGLFLVNSASKSMSDRPCGCSLCGCSFIKLTTLMTRIFSNGRC